MNKIEFVLLPISLLLVMSCTSSNMGDFPVLKGPYFGQTPPGNNAELFAYDLLSANHAEGYIRFSPDGEEMIFGLITEAGRILVEPKGVFGKTYQLYSVLVDKIWSEPKEIDFDWNFLFSYASYSVTGDTIVFNSYGPGGSPDNNPQSRTWFIKRNENGWSKPSEIIFGDNYDGPGTVYPTMASNGNLYFAQFYDGVNGYLYMSKFENGRYSLPIRLDDSINDVGGNHPLIAPDESFIIFDSERPDDTFGTSDLYISFRDNIGNWLKPINLGQGINSRYDERRAFLSFDKKYLFFASDRIDPTRPDHPLTITELQKLTKSPNDSQQHIYWVSANIINKLNPNSN